MMLEKMIINGVLSRLKTVLGLKTDPLFLPTNDRWKLAERVKSQLGSSLQLPQVYLHLQSLEINADGLNAQSLAYMGVYAQGKVDGTVTNRHFFMPVAFTFEVLHLSDDFWDMMGFCRKLLLTHRKRSRLGFTLTYDGIDMDVRVMVDDQISVPEKDAIVDVPNLYEATAGLRVIAYITEDLADVDEVPLITQIHSTLQTASNL